MRAFVAGATGVLGRLTLKELLAGGHEVAALARTPAAEKSLAAPGVTPVRGDLFNPATLERGVQGCDTVFHLATHIPQKAIPRVKDYDENNRIRTEGTRLLIDAARRTGVRTFLFQSVAFIFGEHQGATVTEQTAPYTHSLVESAVEGERLTMESGMRGVALRGGLFFQRGSFHTDKMAEAVGKRQFPLIGRGDGFFHPLHPRDLARAFVLAAESDEASGVYHVAAESVEMRVLLTEWAARIGAKPPRRIPTWLARILLGDFATMAGFRYRVSSERIKQELGFQFEFPTYREILDTITG